MAVSTSSSLNIHSFNGRNLDTLLKFWVELWKMKPCLQFPFSGYWPAMMDSYLHNPPRSVWGLTELHFPDQIYTNWRRVAQVKKMRTCSVQYINKCKTYIYINICVSKLYQYLVSPLHFLPKLSIWRYINQPNYHFFTFFSIGSLITVRTWTQYCIPSTHCWVKYCIFSACCWVK